MRRSMEALMLITCEKCGTVIYAIIESNWPRAFQIRYVGDLDKCQEINGYRVSPCARLDEALAKAQQTAA